MAEIGNIPVQCPICTNLIVVPVTAEIVKPFDHSVELQVSVDDDRWAQRLREHIKKYHG